MSHYVLRAFLCCCMIFSCNRFTTQWPHSSKKLSCRMSASATATRPKSATYSSAGILPLKPWHLQFDAAAAYHPITASCIDDEINVLGQTAGVWACLDQIDRCNYVHPVSSASHAVVRFWLLSSLVDLSASCCWGALLLGVLWSTQLQAGGTAQRPHAS